MAMAGQPFPQGGGGRPPMPYVGGIMDPNVPTTYEGWKLVKAEPPPGKKASFNTIVKSQLPYSQEELAKLIKTQEKKGEGSVDKDIRKLRTDAQRTQINLLASDKRDREPNPNAEWVIASVEDQRRYLDNWGRVSECAALIIVLKRQRKGAKDQARRGSKVGERPRRLSEPVRGEIVDLEQRRNMTMAQANQRQPQYNPNQHMQPQQPPQIHQHPPPGPRQILPSVLPDPMPVNRQHPDMQGINPSQPIQVVEAGPRNGPPNGPFNNGGRPPNFGGPNHPGPPPTGPRALQGNGPYPPPPGGQQQGPPRGPGGPPMHQQQQQPHPQMRPPQQQQPPFRPPPHTPPRRRPSAGPVYSDSSDNESGYGGSSSSFGARHGRRSGGGYYASDSTPPSSPSESLRRHSGSFGAAGNGIDYERGGPGAYRRREHQKPGGGYPGEMGVMVPHRAVGAGGGRDERRYSERDLEQAMRGLGIGAGGGYGGGGGRRGSGYQW